MENNKNTQDHKLPTIEEFFNLKAREKGWEDFHHYLAFDSSHSDFETKLLLEWNKEFAKLHVEAAAKNCLEKYHHSIQEGYDFGSSEIMNSYNLNNIK